MNGKRRRVDRLAAPVGAVGTPRRALGGARRGVVMRWADSSVLDQRAVAAADGIRVPVVIARVA
jgi:hypothetical protein